MQGRPEKYFIGYALSGTERGAVDALRGRIADAFGVRAALRIPPHITLFTPFETGAAASLAQEIRRRVQTIAPFVVPVTGFEAFRQAVWFLDVAKDRALVSLKDVVAAAVKGSLGISEREDRRDPHFHVTLAYKDVSPDVHRRIGEFLRGEPLPIDGVRIDSVVLFGRRADDDGWEPREVFPFGGPSER